MTSSKREFQKAGGCIFLGQSLYISKNSEGEINTRETVISSPFVAGVLVIIQRDDVAIL